MDKKQNGQYMTPKNIVELLLNEIGYFGPEILKKTIIEPSFGDGSFLAEIFTRIINEGKKQNLSNSQISTIFSENVYGIEIDNALFDKTIKSLNEIAIKNGLQVNFNNLKNENTLLFYKNYLEKFDYCVGNPPFVRIHNIEDYEKIKEFNFSNGNTDLYVIFYEIGLNLINKIGMSEEFLEQHFPLCYQYFLTFKKELMKRSLDKGANWFWFGRSQGLNTLYQKKLVFSHYINKKEDKINVCELDEDVFVYSGLFTVKKNEDVDLDKIKNVYESNDFIKYCKIVGKPISGNFCYVSSKQIKDFRY